MDIVLHPPEADSRPPGGALEITFPVLPEELPVQLDDFRRSHPSAIPGINLPSSSSSLSGAPGPPDMVLHAMARDMIRENRINGPAAFAAFLDSELERQKAQLEHRMKKRSQAKTQNEELDRELAQLEMERNMQMRVAEKWRKGRRGSDE